MKKIGIMMMIVVFAVILVSCGKKTEVTAEIINIEVEHSSIRFDVELSDPENEITGSTVVYLYNKTGNIRNQLTIQSESDLEGIYFYGLESQTPFTIKVVVTIGRDALEVGTHDFSTLTDQEIVINSVEDFMKMRENRNGKFILGQDIDFSEEFYTSPFNASNLAFGGTFDGNGFALKNMNFSRISMYTGIFGYVSSGVIKNVTLDNINIGTLEEPLSTGTSSRVGLLVAYATAQTAKIEDVTIINSTISMTTSSTIQAYVGAVAAEFKGSIKNVEIIDTNIEVKSSSFGRIKIGGAVALLGSDSVVSQVYSEANIGFTLLGTNIRDDDVSHMIGGIIGQHVSGAKLSEVISTGDISLDIDYNTLPDTKKGVYQLFVGGLVGRANSDVQKGYYSGSITLTHEKNDYEDVVTKQYRIGGLIGFYESNKASNKLVRISLGEIDLHILDDINPEISQVFGFDRFNINSDKGVYGTQQINLNDVSVVEDDDVVVIGDLTSYFDSEFVSSYLES